MSEGQQWQTIRFGMREYRLPFAELFRDLTANEEAELRASIEAVGVGHPVFTYDSPEHGNDCVIDGANRLRIAGELDTDVRVEKLRVSDEVARRMAEDLNAARRQVTPQEAKQARAKRIGKVVELRAEGKSLRAIADEVGVSLGQVQRDIFDSGVSPDTPEVVTGRDGKEYPAAAPEDESGAYPYAPEEDLEEFDDETSEVDCDEDVEERQQQQPAIQLPEVSGPVVPIRDPEKPKLRDPDHPHAELLNAIIAFATRISKAVNDSEPESKLRTYLLNVKYVLPRDKGVNGRHMGWQCIGLRGLYRVIRLAGLPGKLKTKDNIVKEFNRTDEGGAA
jgi:hypothetical protein